jgi:hypothetical protein
VLLLCRHHLRDAELLRLAPKQAWRQHSHALLMDGSLLHCSGGSGGSGNSAAPGRHADLAAPAVLPWLPGHMQQRPARGDAGALPVSAQAAAAAGAAAPLVAGSSGALLMVCPEEGAPVTPASSVDSAADLRSPFAGGALGSSKLVQQQQLDQPGLPSAAGDEPAEEQLEQERLLPVARPLHRVKSRRCVYTLDTPCLLPHAIATAVPPNEPTLVNTCCC